MESKDRKPHDYRPPSPNPLRVSELALAVGPRSLFTADSIQSRGFIKLLGCVSNLAAGFRVTVLEFVTC